MRGHLAFVRVLTRLMLWGLGVWYIRVDDRRASREPPVMIAPNHITFLDGWVVYVVFTTMMLSKLSVADLPIFGTIVSHLSALGSRPFVQPAAPRRHLPPLATPRRPSNTHGHAHHSE